MHVWQRYSLADLERGDPKTVKRIRQGNARRAAFLGFEDVARRTEMAMKRFIRAMEVAHERKTSAEH